MSKTIELTGNQIRSMVAKYRNGATAAELSEEFGMSTSSVLRVLRDAKVKIRSRGRRPSEG